MEISPRRSPKIFVAALVALACTDAPAGPELKLAGARLALSVEAAAAVQTVLADVEFRMGDAIEDRTTRVIFEEALARLTSNLGVGQLDAAETNAFSARLALAHAAALDTDGTGDADRSAISLALDVANDEINKARQQAAGGY